MGRRVLLISINRCAVPDPVFPLGLAHLSGALEAAGHEVRWYDMLVDRAPLEEVLREFRPQLAGISIRNIDDVLIRKRETYFDSLGELCQRIRTVAGCPVVLGGSGFSIFPSELMEFSGADFGICGAGEGPLLALLDSLESTTRDSSARTPVADLQIPGLLCRDSHGGIRAVVDDGKFPVAHDGAGRARVEPVRPVWVADFYLQAGGMLNLQTQRGCAFHCCYCTYPVIEGRAHRRQPADAVAEEFAAIQRLGGRYAFIVDSVFNSSPRHVIEVCEAILRRGVRMKWGCFLRPQGLTAELMSLMVRAGLSHIEFGSDSLTDHVLKAYHKGFTFEEIEFSSELARTHNLDYCHFLIAGGPAETDQTLTESFENSRKLRGAVFMAVVGMRIYPGTALHRRAVDEGQLAPGTNLLSPRYYVSPHLSEAGVFRRLEEFARISPNWIVGDPVPGYAGLVERLRKRGVAGPMWSYLSIIQRFWPVGTGPLPGGRNTDLPSVVSHR